MEKVWEIVPRKFDDIIDQLLYNRGIIHEQTDEELKEAFFRPDFEKNLHDPFLMKGIAGAAERIKAAKEKGEKVGIFADYDADGIPGAALLYKALKKIGIEPIVYIPNREGGYGLSEEGINYLVENKCSLIITVDLGIRNLKEADYCKKIGVGLIITDHHLPGPELPKPDVLINPKQEGDKYPFKELCGCGVAYKLIQGLSKEFPKELNERFLKWNLDLVAISSISDVVPLTGENRVLAKYGLIVIEKTQNIGLQELIKAAKIDSKSMTAYTVGFQIGPRINAPGRIDHATKSFELLVTEDQKEAQELADWLNKKNEERQLAMDQVQKEASGKIEKEKLDKQKIIIVAGNWQKGVIGPTASKLVEKYGRPVILFSKSDDYFTGSARSVTNVNIVSLFEEIKDLIYKFGGHKGAAGISVEASKYEKFIQSLLKIADEKISDSDLKKKIKVDCVVKMPELSPKLYEKLVLFEPFGMGNSKPVFLAENVRLLYPRFVGKTSDHFSSLASGDNCKLKTIYFNFPYEKDKISDEVVYDLAFNLTQDEWQGEKRLNLNIVDLKANVPEGRSTGGRA